VLNLPEQMSSGSDELGITDEVLHELINSHIIQSGSTMLPKEFMKHSEDSLHDHVHNSIFDFLSGIPEHESISHDHITAPIRRATIIFIKKNRHPLLGKSNSYINALFSFMNLEDSKKKLDKLCGKYIFQNPKTSVGS
jgi:hypothetical protein